MQRILIMTGLAALLVSFQNCSNVGFGPGGDAASAKTAAVDATGSINSQGADPAMGEIGSTADDDAAGELDTEDGQVCLGNGVKVQASNIVSCASAGVAANGHGGRCVYVCEADATKILNSVDARARLAAGATEGECKFD